MIACNLYADCSFDPGVYRFISNYSLPYFYVSDWYTRSIANRFLGVVVMSVVLSGIQPSGSLHIGHLVGALENFSALQKDNKVFYMIAD